MKATDLISETDASALTGYGPQPLALLAKYGHLTAQRAADGTVRFSRRELEEKLGVRRGLATADLGGVEL